MILWRDPIYYDPKGPWDFMPSEHRPGGSRALHDDWPAPFNHLPRTWTSFIFVSAKLLAGNTTNFFEWQSKIYPKPWCFPWQWQKTRVSFRDPITKELHNGIYKSNSTFYGNYAYRVGPRISDDLEANPPTVYVNWIPIPILGKLLTLGMHEINPDLDN